MLCIEIGTELLGGAVLDATELSKVLQAYRCVEGLRYYSGPICSNNYVVSKVLGEYFILPWHLGHSTA